MGRQWLNVYETNETMKSKVDGKYIPVAIGIEFLDQYGDARFVKTWCDKNIVVNYKGQTFEGEK